MKEFSRVCAGIGAMVLTFKSLFWLSIVFNYGIALAVLIPLVGVKDTDDEIALLACPMDVIDKVKSLSIWCMITTLLAASSLLAFT